MILFPDSNVFIHFQPIENWDWKSGERIDFRIGVCRCIISELDKTKYSGNSNATRRRVQGLIKKLSNSSDYIFNKIPFTIVLPENLSDTLQNANLDKEDKDDLFIGSVLNYKACNPSDEICIVSNDLGVQLKCKAHKLNYKIPEEKYLIQEEDASEKEIKKLTLELNRVKNLQPKLRLQFENGEVFKKFDVNEPWPEYEDEIAEEMESIKKVNPLLEPEPDTKISGLSLMDVYKKTPEKVAKFNEALQKYYSDYEAYLRRTKVLTYKEDLTLILKIEISNSGNTPGENIDLFMHFPDGFTLCKKDDYYTKEREPSPPELSSYSLAPIDMTDLITRFPLPTLTNFDLGGFSITKTNSYDVEKHFNLIKHNHIGKVYPLYITFDRFEEVESFEITYQITAANMVEMVEDKLKVIVTKIADTPDE